MKGSVKVLNKTRLRMLLDAEEAEGWEVEIAAQLRAKQDELQALRAGATELADAIVDLGGDIVDNINDPRLAP